MGKRIIGNSKPNIKIGDWVTADKTGIHRVTSVNEKENYGDQKVGTVVHYERIYTNNMVRAKKSRTGSCHISHVKAVSIADIQKSKDDAMNQYNDLINEMMRSGHR